jgi:hypothetical protein
MVLPPNFEHCRLSKPVQSPIFAADNSRRESADEYGRVIVQFNARWRVIECRDRIQWILQRIDGERHGKKRWTGRSYCRTREGLTQACRMSVGEIDINATAILKNLPDFIEGHTKTFRDAIA